MVRQATHEGLHHLHDIGVGATDRAVLFDVDGVLVDSYPTPTPNTGWSAT
jgi:hypothetical protein